jgi:hypothetical protein
MTALLDSLALHILPTLNVSPFELPEEGSGSAHEKPYSGRRAISGSVNGSGVLTYPTSSCKSAAAAASFNGNPYSNHYEKTYQSLSPQEVTLGRSQISTYRAAPAASWRNRPGIASTDLWTSEKEDLHNQNLMPFDSHREDRANYASYSGMYCTLNLQFGPKRSTPVVL